MINECGESPPGLEMLPQGWDIQQFGQQVNNSGNNYCSQCISGPVGNINRTTHPTQIFLDMKLPQLYPVENNLWILSQIIFLSFDYFTSGVTCRDDSCLPIERVSKCRTTLVNERLEDHIFLFLRGISFLITELSQLGWSLASSFFRVLFHCRYFRTVLKEWTDVFERHWEWFRWQRGSSGSTEKQNTHQTASVSKKTPELQRASASLRCGER